MKLIPLCRMLGQRLLLLVALLVMLTGEAWAELPQPPQPADKNYGPAYAFVALLIILGLLLVLRPSNRAKEFRLPTED